MVDVTSLKEQYNKIKAHDLQSEGTAGVLYYNKDKAIAFRPSTEVTPVYKFPHRKGDKTEGAVVMYESPYTTKEGEVPHNLYFLCHDPYAQEKSGSNESLGAAFVMKRPNNLSKPDDIIVASYVGRPRTQDEYNRNLFMLAEYYNAKNVRRQYGMHMTEQRKRQGELYIRDWLITPRHTDEDGNTTLNLHRIYDPALLQELIKFNHKGNFDRVMAFMVGMYHTRELYNKEVVEILKDGAADEWFDRIYQ